VARRGATGGGRNRSRAGRTPAVRLRTQIALVDCAPFKISSPFIMKPDIHPAYTAIKATCSCGNVIETRSTLGADLHLDVCSNCHPFYTGRQKIVDSGGRVERFRKRFGKRSVG
jgi:large subunit ribosomal protein L31